MSQSVWKSCSNPHKMAKEIPSFILEYQDEQQQQQQQREKFDAANPSQAKPVSKSQTERKKQQAHSGSKKSKTSVKKVAKKTKEPREIRLTRLNRAKAKDLFRRQIGPLDGKAWSKFENIKTLDELYTFFAQHGVTYRKKDFLPQKKTKYKKKHVAKSVRAISTPMS